jgi:DNA polymerase III delta prime subunit
MEFPEISAEQSVKLGLYGNVKDLFYDGKTSKYLSISRFLALNLDKFKIRARWDRIDGFRFPSKTDFNNFTNLLSQQLSEDEPEGEEYDLDGDGGDTKKEEKKAPSKMSCDEMNGGPQFIAPEEAFPAIRAVLTADDSRGLFILDWSEHLLTSSSQQDLSERNQLIMLGKAISDQPSTQLTGAAMGQTTGLLLIVTPNLGAIPSIFYTHDPRIRIMAIPKPNLEERRDMITRHQSDLSFAQTENKAFFQMNAVEMLAERTDGMSYVDIRNIIALAKQSRNMTMDTLLNLYKFGEKDSPWEKLNKEKISQAEEIIKQRVKGQDEAVSRVTTMIIRAYLGLSGIQHSTKMSKPKGTMFFVGPTGVGKTELAKSIAEFIFGDENNCIRFDMSEFSQEHADQRLIGAPPGYVGFEDGGQLTNAVAEKPFSVLLFDEIEKAHPRVLDKFLQILEDGRLTDGRGQTVHFSESVLIFTSNIGANSVQSSSDKDAINAQFMDAVRTHFNEKLGRPELLNRFGDNIVVFNFIDDPEIRKKIILSKLEGVKGLLKEKYSLNIVLDDKVIDHFVKSGQVSHGGRGLINVLERELINPLSLFIFERLHMIKPGKEKDIRVSKEKGEITFQWDK